MNLQTLEFIVNDQREYFRAKDTGVKRSVDFDKYLNTNQITIITGVRRCGKSTLMLQIARLFDDYHFITFDDERFVNFTVDDFQQLMLVLHKRSDAKILFFDEIQNIPQWERFVRRLHDTGYKLFITGSNANLLSSELGTHLTGRYLKINLFPFSFKEFLLLKNIETNPATTARIAEILKTFDEYLQNGGFPEFAKNTDTEILKRTYEDIIYRDVIARYQISEIKSFKQVAAYLFTNIAKEFSYQAIAGATQIKSATSVKNYIYYLETVYLTFELYKYDFSLKKQYVSNKKIYAIDSGLRNTISFLFSDDKGRLLENIVYIELLRHGKTVYFFKDKNECDFIIEERGVITEAIQVCWDLSPENLIRETNGLTDAMEKFNLKIGKIITYNTEDTHQENEKTIEIISIWKWLL